MTWLQEAARSCEWRWGENRRTFNQQNKGGVGKGKKKKKTVAEREKREGWEGGRGKEEAGKRKQEQQKEGGSREGSSIISLVRLSTLVAGVHRCRAVPVLCISGQEFAKAHRHTVCNQVCKPHN